MAIDNTVFPTKGNLLATKKSLLLALMGFDLLDRKRNILIREMMTLLDKAKAVRSEIDSTYAKAYAALQKANITLGICGQIADSIPEETGLTIRYRSVMGVELPTVALECDEEPSLPGYSFSGSNSQLANAYLCFHRVKRLTAQLAEIENSIYRLATAIKKAQSRANALKNIIIPRFDATSKYITESLEEKEREEFARMKVIKATKERALKGQVKRKSEE